MTENSNKLTKISEGRDTVSFDEIMTEIIKQDVEREVRADFKKLFDAFRNFYCKYCMSGITEDIEKIKRHALKCLSSENMNFIMFPELEEYLFIRKSRQIVNSVLEEGGATNGHKA